MALDQLIAALERDAARAAEQRMRDAELEAVRLRSEAQARSDAKVAGELLSREKGLRGEIERALIEQRRRLRREMLQRRQSLLDQIRVMVETRLPAATQDPGNRSDLGRNLEDAFAYVDGLPAVVHAPPELVDWARNLLEGRSNVTVEADPALTSGMVVTTADGSVSIDTTLATRLRQSWPRLSITLLGWIERPES